jgi:alpha-beta hydrolase superfamily lysophospholipase
MFVQNHYIPQKIKCPQREGIAYWSTNPTGHAIVFVHGFRGHVTNTWQEFPSLLTASQDFAGHDLIFYTYDTMATQAYPSGLLFKQFLDQLVENPLEVRNQKSISGAIQLEDLYYKRLIIVAHSLGAVVSRVALVEAYREKKDWLLKTRLILFAPAHRGARVQELLMSTVTPVPWLAPLLAGSFYNIPVFKDLDPKNSEVLKQLLEETNKAQEQVTEASKRLLADLTIYGADDKVIEAVRFSDDPGPIVAPGKNHFSVCKPAQDYSLPIHKLLGVL